MHIVFIDEAGYTPNWVSGIAQQPFYALSAVCVPAARLPGLYATLRREATALAVPGLQGPLGLGHEIKARDVVGGRDWWGKNNLARNALRDTFLGSLPAHDAVAILAVIDKAAHRRQYVTPDDPYELAMRFVFERIGMHLNDVASTAYVIYDHNARTQPNVLRQAARLIYKGSRGTGYSSFYGQVMSFALSLDRIIELGFGDSKHSLGLQVADFFATCGYAYHRDGKPAPCGWWSTLCGSLRTRNGRVEGAGLKVHPA